MARNDPEHVDKIIDSKFNRRPTKTEDYRSKCTTGYVFTTSDSKAAGKSDFHHILPIHTLGSDHLVPDDKIDFFHNCMAMTEWDINDGHNLIGLPTRDVYREYDQGKKDRLGVGPSGQGATTNLSVLRSFAARLGMFGVIPDLPCHQNHHSEYNKGVIDYLQQQIWRPLAREQEKCSLSGVTLRSQLRGASKHWRDFLESRGRECQGASHCWVHRNDKGYDKFWYIPFSMHPGTPPPWPPPPEWSGGAKSARKAWLSSLFPGG